MATKTRYVSAEVEDRCFEKLLQLYLNRKNNARILNVFCGPVTEEPALLRYFGKGTDLTSIDNDSKLEKIANSRRAKSFVHGDVDTLERHVKGRYDLVMMRNPPIIMDEEPELQYENWPRLLRQLGELLQDDGVFLMTILNHGEWREIEPQIRCAGYRNMRSEPNFMYVPSDGVGVAAESKDNFVITGRKPVWWSKLLGKML